MELLGPMVSVCVCVYVFSRFSHVRLFAIPWSPTTSPHPPTPTPSSCPWDFPSKNTGVGCHALLQGIFSAQGSNSVLLHYRQILYC